MIITERQYAKICIWICHGMIYNNNDTNDHDDDSDNNDNDSNSNNDNDI